MHQTRPFGLLALTGALSLTAVAAFAQYVGPSTVANLKTVKEVLANPKDDTQVTLTGNITAKVGNEKYTFTDKTGSIRVEIDNEDFPAGKAVDAKQTVQIIGEVENDFLKSPEIDVDTVRLI